MQYIVIQHLVGSHNGGTEYIFEEANASSECQILILIIFYLFIY